MNSYYMKYSTDSSSKIALLVEEIYYKSLAHISHVKWKHLESKDKIVLQLGYAFHQHSFSFRMLHKLINRLIDTGIMNRLVDLHLDTTNNFIKMRGNVKFLNLNDLSIGFIIWIGFSGISVIIFIIELLMKSTINPIVDHSI